jgi:MoaA/NifB/PqqE/SkfB family radical SAM enzyme
MRSFFKIKSYLLENPLIRKSLYRAKLAAMKTNPTIYSTIRLGSFPKGLFIQTQSRCNARCIVCPLADENYRKSIPQGRMSDSLFSEIIDECSQHNVKEISPEFLNEPLMDPLLEDRIEYIREKCPSTYISIMSNGSILDKERAIRLANSGLDRICFSVHGLSRETYEKNMGGLDIHKTLNNIDCFLSVNKDVQVRVAIMENLIPRAEFQEALTHWKTRGVPVEIQRSNDRAGSLSDNPYVVWKAESKGKIKGCMFDYPLRYMAVHFNGEVVLCCYDWQREILLGNLNQSSIRDIWNSKKFQDVRHTIYGHCLPGFICDRCVIAVRKADKTPRPCVYVNGTILL